MKRVSRVIITAIFSRERERKKREIGKNNSHEKSDVKNRKRKGIKQFYLLKIIPKIHSKTSVTKSVSKATYKIFSRKKRIPPL